MAVETSRGSGASALSQLADSGEDVLDSIEDQEELEAAPTRENEPPKVILDRLLGWIDNQNIARDVDADILRDLGMLVVREYEIDEQSRSEWKDEAQKALDFATQTAQPKQYPWPDSSNVIFPLITSAAMRFGAVAYPAIVPNRNVVKGVVWGDDKGTPVTQDGKPDGAPKLTDDGQPVWLIQPGMKKRRAEKIGEHMSYQLLEQLGYWEEQTDTMLHQLPIVGGAVRKTYRDTREDCNASELVELMNLVWNMNAKSFEKAPRHTEIQEIYPHEIEELERDDQTFLPLNYGPGDVAPATSDPSRPAPDQSDSEAPHVFVEQHRRFDLDGDGYPEPLIVTVHLRSANVVRIVTRFEETGLITDDKTDALKRIDPCDSYTLYRFLPNPKGGSYPCGFGHYLKPLNEAVNTTINQMFDAGHLQIAGGGFIGTGLSVHAGPTNFSIGEYKPVNTKGGNIRDSIFPMPWPGPNEVLFQLLGFLVGAAKEVASVQDVLTGDSAMANTPPTTMLALVDQGMKVYTAIYKRIYRALKSELKKLYRLNRLYLTEDERYRIGDTWRTVTPDDYRLGGGVEPVADPTMVTDMQRITRAALIVDRAKNNPLVNPLEAERYLFEAAQIPRIDDFLPEKMPPPQKTPEMMKAETEAARAQQEGQELQFKVQEAQSKLGLTRAQELQAYTQAMVNFAKAKSSLTEPQVAFMEQQLQAMRLHIEALNTTVKAADVDAKIHGHTLTHKARMAQTSQRASEVANEQPGPANDGGGGAAGPDIPEPRSDGIDGGGAAAVAPPSGNTMLPSLPGSQEPVA
jgi:chaperonin GroES